MLLITTENNLDQYLSLSVAEGIQQGFHSVQPVFKALVLINTIKQSYSVTNTF